MDAANVPSFWFLDPGFLIVAAVGVCKLLGKNPMI